MYNSRTNKTTTSLDLAAKENLQFRCAEEHDGFDDESSYSSYSDSDDSDASSLDGMEWDMEMEQLEFRVNSFLGAAKSNPYSALWLTKNTAGRKESTIFASPEEDSIKDEVIVNVSTDNDVGMNPVCHLTRILQSLDVTIDAIVPSIDSYVSIEEHHLATYAQLAPVARKGDLETMKKMYNAGVCLQSCNYHGESIVHIVCRRGYRNILEFLLQKAGISLRVRDDVGRTPLHDAAWTNTPDFELIRMILVHCPDFLLVKDKRGHLALAYVPRDQWSAWCSFLNENQHLVKTALESKYVEIRM